MCFMSRVQWLWRSGFGEMKNIILVSFRDFYPDKIVTTLILSGKNLMNTCLLGASWSF